MTSSICCLAAVTRNTLRDERTAPHQRYDGQSRNGDPGRRRRAPLSGYSQVVTIGGKSFLAPIYSDRGFDVQFDRPDRVRRRIPLGPEPALGNNSRVTEKDKGGYFQANFRKDLGGVMVRGNMGLRYVETEQSATGFGFVGGAVQEVTVPNKYRRLPAVGKPGVRADRQADHPLRRRRCDDAADPGQPDAGHLDQRGGRQPHRHGRQPQARAVPCAYL